MALMMLWQLAPCGREFIFNKLLVDIFRFPPLIAGQRQGYLEFGPDSDLAFDVDLPFVLLNNIESQTQTQPGALTYFLGGEERFEYLFQIVLFDTATVILE